MRDRTIPRARRARATPFVRPCEAGGTRSLDASNAIPLYPRDDTCESQQNRALPKNRPCAHRLVTGECGNGAFQMKTVCKAGRGRSRPQKRRVWARPQPAEREQDVGSSGAGTLLSSPARKRRVRLFRSKGGRIPTTDAAVRPDQTSAHPPLRGLSNRGQECPLSQSLRTRYAQTLHPGHHPITYL